MQAPTAAEARAAPAGKSLAGSDFLSMTAVNPEALQHLLADTQRRKRARPNHGHPLAGKTLALIFAKPSTRTRVSFEVAMRELGGDALVLHARDMQMGRGETVADTGAVLARYVSGIAVRTFSHAEMETLAAAATVPVINALSDRFHPCQALADVFTVQEVFGRLEGLRLAYVGDGNNVAQSLLLAAALGGAQVAVATPPGFEPDADVVARAREQGGGDCVHLTDDPVEAVSGAHAVYTDVWTSMGREEEGDQRRRVFGPYRVTARLCRHARDDFIFMHCLPAHRGEEVTAEVIDGPHSVVLDQAENRLHVQKSLLLALLA